MDYHLDNRIVLSTEREHKSLYPWSIKEFDAAGKQIGGDQIPWAWSIYFVAEHLSITRSVKIESDASQGSQSNSKVSEVIRARLMPEARRRDVQYYSMFGTSRAVTDIDLLIYRTETTSSERCHLWGSVSYTAEWDFEDLTNPDCIQIYAHIHAEKFDRLALQIDNAEPIEVSVRLGSVHGFYSEWSPSIRTSSIKVLANAQDQQLENPEGLDLEPPSLGKVEEFEISFKRQIALQAQPNAE